MRAECPYCERSFTSQTGVQIHVGVMHKGKELPYSVLRTKKGDRT